MRHSLMPSWMTDNKYIYGVAAIQPCHLLPRVVVCQSYKRFVSEEKQTKKRKVRQGFITPSVPFAERRIIYESRYGSWRSATIC